MHSFDSEYCRVVNPIDGVIVSKKQMPPRKTWKVD